MTTTANKAARLAELSDADVDAATPDELRAAYRALREHHVAETTALTSRRDDLTRRRDEQLARSQQVAAESQKLIERADAIMTSDQETIDRLGNENARLSEIVDFMQNRYSPIGGRGCALCVYVEGRLIRPCAMHRWEEETRRRQGAAAKVLAPRTADPADPSTTDHLTDEELAGWAKEIGLDDPQLAGTYLRMVVEELRDRRLAESIFAEIDRAFQAIDCPVCDDVGADNCGNHRALVRRWRSARAALCDLARVHRRYLLSLNAPGGGDPR